MSRLGGWWRIWFVLSAVFLGFALLAAISDRSYTAAFKGDREPWAVACLPFTREKVEAPWSEYAKNEYQRASESEMVLVDGQLVDVRPGDPRYRTPEQRGLSRPQTEYLIQCASWTGLLSRIGYAVVWSFVLAIAGLALRWVYRGFKKKQQQ